MQNSSFLNEERAKRRGFPKFIELLVRFPKMPTPNESVAELIKSIAEEKPITVEITSCNSNFLKKGFKNIGIVITSVPFETDVYGGITFQARLAQKDPFYEILKGYYYSGPRQIASCIGLHLTAV